MTVTEYVAAVARLRAEAEQNATQMPGYTTEFRDDNECNPDGGEPFRYATLRVVVPIEKAAGVGMWLAEVAAQTGGCMNAQPLLNGAKFVASVQVHTSDKSEVAP